MNLINKIYFIVLTLLIVPSVYSKDLTIGDASENITLALTSMTDLILAAVSIAGVGAFFGSLMKLYHHRKNPQQVPLSQFFVLLVMAIALIGLPVIILWGDSAYNIIKNL